MLNWKYRNLIAIGVAYLCLSRAVYSQTVELQCVKTKGFAGSPVNESETYPIAIDFGAQRVYLFGNAGYPILDSSLNEVRWFMTFSSSVGGGKSLWIVNRNTGNFAVFAYPATEQFLLGGVCSKTVSNRLF